MLLPLAILDQKWKGRSKTWLQKHEETPVSGEAGMWKDIKEEERSWAE